MYVKQTNKQLSFTIVMTLLQIDSLMLIHNSCILSHTRIFTLVIVIFSFTNKMNLPFQNYVQIQQEKKNNHFNLSSESLCKKSSMSTNDIS